jgi:hypothetical protein
MTLFKKPIAAFALFLLALFAWQALPARAAPDPVFTVEDVQVDVTSDNADAARTQAFNQAQVKAFQTLADRMLSDDERKSFQVPSADVISGLVSDFEITDEKLSRVRYIGTYTFRFKKEAVRAYMSSTGLSYTDVGSKTVLILPFYQRGGETVLWGGDNNPWLFAWSKQTSSQGLVPVTVPIGDLEDVSDITDTQALTYNPDSLTRMLGRYRAGDAVVAIATPAWNPGSNDGADIPPDTLQLAIYATDKMAPRKIKDMTVAASEAREGETIFDAGVRKMRGWLQSDWKSKTVSNVSQDNRLKVRVRFGSMQEWIETQKALNRVQGVNDVELLSLTPAAANVEIHFTGTEDRLRLAMTQSDMTLSQPKLDFSGNAAPLSYELWLNKYAPVPAQPPGEAAPAAAVQPPPAAPQPDGNTLPPTY